MSRTTTPRCDMVLTRPRHAELGTPQRHLPAIEFKCKAPAPVTLVRPANYQPGWDEKVRHLCEEHATQFLGRGVTGFARS